MLQGSPDALRRALAHGLAGAWQVLLRGPVPLLLLLGAIAVLEVVLVGVVKNRVAAGPLFRVEPAGVGIDALPAWVPDRVGEELAARSSVGARSIMDPELERELRTAFEGHAWVARVARVRRVFPDQIALELELRQPKAVVEVGAWRLTVDAAGRVLDDRASLAPNDVPSIRADAKTVTRIPFVGGVFTKGPVLHGLSVLRDLAAHQQHPALAHLQLAAIDVTHVGDARGSEILIELVGGPIIEWGSAGESRLAAIEVPTTRKLDNLQTVESDPDHRNFRGLVRVNLSTIHATATAEG